MIFHARDERALARIEASLTQSDPGLAAEFERFNARAVSTPAEAERRVRRRAQRKKLLALLIITPAAVLAVWGTVTGNVSQRRGGGCVAVAGAVCPVGPPVCQGASDAISHGKGPRPCGTQSPSNAP
jgi:ferric-dicitrate binding protein FerR (iron transport regulator)